MEQSTVEGHQIKLGAHFPAWKSELLLQPTQTRRKQIKAFLKLMQVSLGQRKHFAREGHLFGARRAFEYTHKNIYLDSTRVVLLCFQTGVRERGAGVSFFNIEIPVGQCRRKILYNIYKRFNK
jgi:hypothetical protein